MLYLIPLEIIVNAIYVNPSLMMIQISHTIIVEDALPGSLLTSRINSGRQSREWELPDGYEPWTEGKRKIAAERVCELVLNYARDNGKPKNLDLLVTKFYTREVGEDGE